MANLFLSHSSQDNLAAASLCERLKARGYESLFLDIDAKDGIPAGKAWERQLYRKLSLSQAVIVLCSEHSMNSRWCFVEIAQAKALGKRIFPFVISPCQVDPILTEFQVIDLLAEGEERAFHRLLDGLHAAGLDPEDSFDWDSKRPPFPGLNHFDFEDAGIYFGREDEIHRVIEMFTRMRRQGGRRLLVIVGSSGSGKSSLVRAGVLPRLDKDRSRCIVIGPFRPGSDPVSELARAVSSKFPEWPHRPNWKVVRDQLRGQSRAEDSGRGAGPPATCLLTEYADDLAMALGLREAPVLVVVDQVEELLQTAGKPPQVVAVDDPTALLTALRRATERPGGRVFGLLTLRSDFLGTFQNHPALRGVDFANMPLGPLPVERFPRVIEGPAHRAEIVLKPGLVSSMVADARTDDSLPLVAFTLREMYNRCRDRSEFTFTLEMYRDDLQGIRGAVARVVERIKAESNWTPEIALELRRAFLKLVRVNDEGQFIRQRARWADLPDRAASILEAFVEARLLTSDGDTVEVAHESLFRVWPELAGWLDEGRELMLWKKHIQVGVKDWIDHDRSSPYLLGGARVAEARRWLDSNADDFPGPEAEFLEASIIAEDRRLAREKAQQEERIRLARKRARAVTMAAVLGMVAVAVTFVAIRVHQDRGAVRLAKTRLLQDASLDRERMGDSGTSAVLLGHALVEASGQDRDLENSLRVAITLARSRLLPLRDIFEVAGGTHGCAVSPDGALAVVGSDKGRVWFVDLMRSRLTPNSHSTGLEFYQTGDHEVHDSVSSVAFDPLRPRFAAATLGGTIHVVETTAGSKPRKVFHPGQPLSVGFSPDGRALVAAGRRGDRKRHAHPLSLAIYDVESGACSRAFPLDYDLYVAAISPDGRWLAAAGGIPPHPLLAVWDLRAPESPPRILRQPARVFILAFRPTQSSRLVTGDVNGGVRFWDLAKKPGQEADGQEIQHDRQVRVTSFSEDGRLLLVGGEDGSAQVWDAEGRFPVGQRLQHRGEVRAGAISLKAGRIVTGDFAGEIHLWDLEPTARAGRRLRHPSPVWDATFNEAGDLVLTGCASSVEGPGAGRVWNLAGGEPTLLRHGADVMVALFRPNSAGQAVTCGNDGSVLFWDTTTGKRIGAQLSHEGRLVYSAAFDATGRSFAFAGLGPLIRICNVDPRADVFRPVRVVDHPISSFVWNLRFGPDGGRLFSDGGPGVRAWDLNAGGTPPVDLRPPMNQQRIEGQVEVLLGGIDALGRRVLTLSWDGTAAVWDLTNPSASPRFLGDRPHGYGRFCADWHAKTDLIATGGADGNVHIWKPDGSRWTKDPLRHPSPVEVLRFSPDGNWLATGCRDGGLRLWSVAKAIWTGAGWYHAGPVTRVQFSQDGRRLLSASRDGTARVVPVPERTDGAPKAILAELEADAGILVAVEGTGTTSSVTAPQPLTAKTFQERRGSAGPAPGSPERSAPP